VKGLDAPLVKALVALRDALEADLVRESTADAEAAANSYRLLIVLLAGATALGLAIAISIFLWITRGLIAQLGGDPADAAAIAHRIADGDLATPVALKEGDEQSLLAAISNMQAHLRELIEGVRASAGELSGQATALSSSSTQIAVSSGQQTEAASSMASSIEQMTASISQVAEHSNEALNISRASGDLSNRGNEVVQSAANEMEQIAASARSMTEIIETLGTQSTQISRIVHVIQEIANQTNLLALNAAIAAARAGEQGRGFSVVAEEVRKLAERTTDSTREIGGMIKAIQDGTDQAVRHMETWSTRVSDGVSKAKGAGECMRDVKDRATEVLSVVNEISHALGEQSMASSQIAQTVERIARMSQENAAAVGSVASSAQHLEEMARMLETVVARFRLAPAV
jgi:methyl-accepting chemotaxis protein